MDRRQLLKRTAVGGAVGIGGIAAYRLSDPGTDDSDASAENTTERSTPPPAEPPVRHAEEFGTVVDARRSGADPEGDVPIDGFLERNAGDDTLLSFGPGTYRLPKITLSGYDNLGIAAAHDEHPTFVAPAGSCDGEPHVRFEEVSDFLLEGVDFDFQREGAGGSVGVIAAGDATVRDVVTRGSCRDQTTMFRIDIRNDEATGLVENVRTRDDQGSSWLTGAYVGTRHSGEVTFRNCELSEFTDNGLYGSAPGIDDDGGGGTVHTEGGHFENNNVSNIRLGTAGSTARGDTIVVESAPEAESVNLRGIRFRRGAGQVVEDCDIRFGPDVRNSFGAIVYHADSGSARVADSRITMDSDNVPAIHAFYYEGSDDEGGSTFENLTIDGEASRGFAVEVDGRDGTTFRNCTIEQTGARRDGIRLAYSEGCELVDSRIDVTGFPLILRDSTLTIRDTTFVTPDGERHIDEREAGPGDFRPGSWSE